MPKWIKNKKELCIPNPQSTCEQVSTVTFSEMQDVAYNIIRSHSEDISRGKESLCLILIGEARTGKSYLINAIRALLNNTRAIPATTGKAAYNIQGVTIHSLLKLPVGPRGNKDLTGQNLSRLQESLKDVKYIIIDEYSMLGQVTFGWIDKRHKQITGNGDQPFGGISLLLTGDPGQLLRVAENPLYHAKPNNDMKEQGFVAYRMFEKVIKLTVNQRVQGADLNQVKFRELLLRLRRGESTIDDWNLLLTHQPTNIPDLTEFDDATRLFFSNEEVQS